MITILVVEDSLEDRKVYDRILSQISGVRVLEAETGEDAVARLERYKVDIFFLDVELPGINGFTLAQKIRSMPAYSMAPILFLTGYSKNPLDALREFHCYDYIVKPFTENELTERIMGLIRDYKNAKPSLPRTKRKMIRLMTDRGIVTVVTDQILFVESHLLDCTLWLPEGLLKLPRVTLTKVIHEVNEPFFVRCHKSFAVNVAQIASIEKISYRLSKIHMKHCDQSIDMSGMFKDKIDEVIQRYLSEGED